MRPSDSWQGARVTAAIAILTALAWLAGLAANGYNLSIWGGFIPQRVDYHHLVTTSIAGTQLAILPAWITPLTATLIHANIVHLAFNLVILVFCGRPTEAAVGPFGIVLLYVLGAYAAAGAQYALDPGSIAPMVGASGAISAVLGAYALLFGRNKVKVASPRLALSLHALWLLAAWVVLNICVGLALNGTDFLGRRGMSIAVGAHIGGFAVGLLLATPLLLFRYRKA